MDKEQWVAAHYGRANADAMDKEQWVAAFVEAAERELPLVVTQRDHVVRGKPETFEARKRIAEFLFDDAAAAEAWIWNEASQDFVRGRRSPEECAEDYARLWFSELAWLIRKEVQKNGH